jgi:hypothetical protein
MDYCPRRILLIALLVGFLPGLAHACSCYPLEPRPCELLKNPEAVFAGKVVAIENAPPDPGAKADYRGLSRYRFSVGENFKGADTPEVDVYSGRGGGDCSYHFKADETYLVYASVGKDGALHVSMCSNTQPLGDAGSLLQQLRAARDRRTVASLFGMVRREQLNHPGAVVQGYGGPISNIEIRLLSAAGKVFITHTDEQGIYAFVDLAPGLYGFDADLPNDTGPRDDRHIGVSHAPEDGEPIRVPGGYADLARLPSAACEEHNVHAFPLGKIHVRVARPDGTPIGSEDPGARLSLFAVDQYIAGGGYQKDIVAGTAEFDNLAPGEYLLVFNDDDLMNPGLFHPDEDGAGKESYHRIFYPDAHDPEHAVRIRIGEQNQLVNVTMSLRNPIVTRRVTIRLAWEGAPPTNAPLFVLLQSDTNQYTVVQRREPGVFFADVRTDGHYWFHGESSCGPFRPVQTGEIVLDGADTSVQELGLVLPRALCGVK